MKRFSPSFFIGTISIGTVEGASCVNLGNNLPSGFVNYKKHNQGFGTIHGNNNDIHGILAKIDEKDIHDTFNYENDDNQNELSKIGNEMMNTNLEIKEEIDVESLED